MAAHTLLVMLFVARLHMGALVVMCLMAWLHEGALIAIRAVACGCAARCGCTMLHVTLSGCKRRCTPHLDVPAPAPQSRAKACMRACVRACMRAC
eukprot:9636370-Alexandrium_andersonii.AAC.1